MRITTLSALYHFKQYLFNLIIMTLFKSESDSKALSSKSVNQPWLK